MATSLFLALLSRLLTPPPPSYQDKLYELQQIIVALNGHIQKVFITSWISCLDKSISVWMNNFICLGFVLFPHKSPPKGNEYHTIFCGESGIMYVWEIV